MRYVCPMPRVFVLGLDCAPPALLFDQLTDVMPNMQALIRDGVHGPLRSCEPPITVPAWTCMVSGRDAGELGLYGFRNRVRGTYDLRVVDATALKKNRVKRVWDYLGDAGHRVAALFVPLTYPVQPVRGLMASCFLTPDGERWTFPPGVGREWAKRFGAPRHDVRDFRTDDKEALQRVYDELFEMADQHFAVAEHVWTHDAPDFAMMVEMGPDRFHHAFWRHIDPLHPRHDAGNPWRDAARRYYAHLDAHIGRLRETLGTDTTLMIVSDHGAKAMQGGVALNDWLIERGWLTLNSGCDAPTPRSQADIDWARSKAWAEGGYYGRVFLNVQGREPGGIVPAAEYEVTRDALAKLLRHIPAVTGRADAFIDVRVTRPDRDYRAARGEPPDLMVYLDNLRLRAVGTIGNASHLVATNDTGPDGCNHDWDGVVVAAGPGIPAGHRLQDAQLFDICRTVLGRFGVHAPGLLGRDLLAGYSAP